MPCYSPPRKASYTPAGSTLAYPVLVHETKLRYGNEDYRISTLEEPTLCQWVRTSAKIHLTFTEEETQP